MATHTAMTQGNDPNLRASLECKVGILHFVSPKEHGWNGVLRKRFTDFQVHEINEDGEVVHLKDYFTSIRDYERATAKKEELSSEQSAQAQAQAQSNASEPGATTATPANAGPITEDRIQQLEIAQSSATQFTAKSTTESNAGNKQQSTDGVAESDQAKLTELLGEEATAELMDFYKKILADPKARPQSHGFVKFPRIADKSARTATHSEIRRIFASKIETETNSDGIIQAKAQPARGNSRWGSRSDNRNRGNQSSQVQIGKFLHFSLYKENKDTMEAINILAGALNMRPNFFSTAGTKDRRAVTVQRVSIRGRDPKKVLSANAKLRGIAIGDFKFSEKDLYLGSHNGNEFTIVLKDCNFQGFESEPFERQLEIAQSTLDRAIADITKKGFINYFGTQRFGTYEIGTQVLGMKILQGDFKGVIEDILSFDPGLAATDPKTLQDDNNNNNRLIDTYRAMALAKYKDGDDVEAAIKGLPKRCNTESTILRHLSKSPNDYHGAILAITRNMRNMYIHAYQSLVWNFVASKRWELFGASVVEGDLVYDEADGATKTGTTGQNADDDDEENIHLTVMDSTREGSKQPVRALTTEDIASGRYSINDVVLSIPGTNVVYPDNKIGEFYKEFMGKEENGALDPYNMQRSQKAFSLTGDYRKFMGSFVGTPSGSVRSYTHDNDQLIPTDMDLIKARQTKARAEAAAAAHAQGPATSGWNSFAKNVQTDERTEASEKFAVAQRRKAEEVDDGPSDVRVKDTWIQTSTDGSNKRIKVDSTSTEVGHENNGCQEADSMEVDKKPIVSQEAAPLPAENTELSKHDGANGTSAPEPSSKSPQSESGAKTILPETTSESANEQNPKAGPSPSVDTPMADPSLDSQVDAPLSPDTAKESMQQGHTVPPTEGQKIAIVLKFSLGSSAYATMVLRELQG
ncbi:pseudouridine synthase [Truncatella angustata]|uniref:Pseudouridine synthase n=1 Tax=Truncatella angustata TaxID=152316 RepID=A0A9P9A427_9PEZI|nr:pseudouridine synthase [Truncatella angustata]KAH6661097.1 pseudouridine synthase [Truncatella angustata]